MDEQKPQDLGINVAENVKAEERFGKSEKAMKGIAGTLHLTDIGQKDNIFNGAWNLSKETQLPVVIVVKAPRTVQ